MLKTKAVLEHVIDGKVFNFSCDPDAAIAVVKEALFEFLKYVGKVEDMAKEQEAAKKAAEAPAPQPVEEPAPQEQSPQEA